MKRLNAVVVFLSCLLLQICPSQAADNEVQKNIDSNASKIMCPKEKNPPLELGLSIPPVAQGHEAVYLRFLNGALIYRPNQESDIGMVTLPIRELTNPLEGTFDLSLCGSTGKGLSILTGYRKGKKPESASKVEIWICPQFLIEKELSTTASHFRPIMAHWKQEKAPVGLFWTWGDWDSLACYDYLTMQSMDELSSGDLYEKWKKSGRENMGVVAGAARCVGFTFRF